MSQAHVIEEVRDILAKEVQTDCVGLWAVLWAVKERLPSLTPAEARATVLAVVREALEREIVVPGEFSEMHFVPWEASLKEAMERLESAWLALGREPNLGEVVWFVARARPN
jgi:hypothetical protein